MLASDRGHLPVSPSFLDTSTRREHVDNVPTALALPRRSPETAVEVVEQLVPLQRDCVLRECYIHLRAYMY